MSSGSSQTRTPVFTRMPEDWKPIKKHVKPQTEECTDRKPVFVPMSVRDTTGGVDKESVRGEIWSSDEDNTESRPLRLFRLDELLPKGVKVCKGFDDDDEVENSDSDDPDRDVPWEDNYEFGDNSSDWDTDDWDVEECKSDHLRENDNDLMSEETFSDSE